MIVLWVDIKETICLEGKLLTGLANIRGILAGRISGGLLYGILRHESRVESEEKAIQFLLIAWQIALV